MTHLQESVIFSQAGQLLRGKVEAFRLEIGIPFTMDTTNFKTCSAYTTEYWYRHLWKFVANNTIEIIEDFPDVPLLCGGGSYLMMAFIAAGYRGIQLKRLNNMRMAMEVVTVVDFVTLDGRRITQRAIALK